MTDKAYDFPREFQQDVLRLFLMDGTFLLGYRGALDAAWFTAPEHRAIAEAALHVFDKTKAQPSAGSLLAAVPDVLEAGCDEEEVYALVRNLYESGIPGDASYIRDRVIDFGRKARLETVLLQGPVYLESGDYDRFVEDVREANVLSADAEAPIYDYVETLQARLDNVRGVQDRVIPTKIEAIDMHLDGGGLGAGEMGLLLGLPGFGKTTTLVNIGYGALESGFKVFHATIGDLSARKAAFRYDCRISGMTGLELRSNRAMAYDRIVNWMNERGGQDRLKINFWPAGRVTVPELETHLRWLEARYTWRPDVIVVDYGLKMASRRNYGENRRLAVAEIHEDLRALGAVLHAPVWTGFQSNRMGHGVGDEGVIGQEHAGEGFDPVRDADVIISLNMTQEERHSGRLRLHGAKVRDDEAGWTETVRMDFARHTISALDAGGLGPALDAA